MNRIFLFIFPLVLGLSWPTPSPQDPLKLYLPDDLEVTLWAESPMFYNPTNMDVDLKGRIWVTEAVNYRNFNNDSTRFRHHQKGDRVMILEDTDQDGKADQSKVFVEDPDLVSPLGIAVMGKYILVSCSPNLILYTGDDQGTGSSEQTASVHGRLSSTPRADEAHTIFPDVRETWRERPTRAAPSEIRVRSPTIGAIVVDRATRRKAVSTHPTCTLASRV